MTTLYIAGPMTGIPENNYPAFHDAERRLRLMGFDVLNPANNEFLPDFEPTWADWMKIAIAQLIRADGIALLDGWENSKGARLENQIAEELQIERYLLRQVKGFYVAATGAQA